MAGVTFLVKLPANALIAEIKQQVFAMDATCIVEQQRLIHMTEEGAHHVLSNESSLASLGIVSETTLHLFIDEPRFVRFAQEFLLGRKFVAF